MYLNLILGLVFLLAGFISLANLPGGGGNGGRAVGLGGAVSGIRGFCSLFNNQAGMAGVQSIVAGSGFENRFLMTETARSSFGLLVPFNHSALGVSLQHFGYSRFREITFGLAYARSFSEKFSVGMQLDYLGYALAEGYGRSGGVTFEGGIQVMLSDDLILGMHVFNPLGINVLPNRGEEPVIVLCIGLGYRISNLISLYGELEKNLKYKTAIKAGLEYDIQEKASIRIGYITFPARSDATEFSYSSAFCFGTGFILNRLHLDLGISMNTVLGWSPVISATYFFGNLQHEK